MGTYFNKEEPASERRQKLRSQMIHPEAKPSKKFFPPGEGNMKKKKCLCPPDHPCFLSSSITNPRKMVEVLRSVDQTGQIPYFPTPQCNPIVVYN